MKNNLFIISGPSGAGEDSVISGLKKELPIEKIVTTTTREIRPDEVDGKDYYYISKTEFEQGIKENNFFEWAKQYNDNLYGVTFEEIKRVQSLDDKIGIWKIEYQGVIDAKKKIPGIVAIMINAPEEVLIERIKARSEVSEEFIQERIDYNKKWIANKNVYDYEVINKQGKLDETIEKVKKIIQENSK